MRAVGNSRITERLKLLYKKMNEEQRISDAELARSGWITRQSLSNAKRPHGGDLQFDSAAQAMALFTVACERGYIVEVFEIIIGSSSSTNVLVIASIIYPDLSSAEAAMLVNAEESFKGSGGKSFGKEIIRSLISTFRTSTR